jgi:hypothetical protein
MAVSHIVIKFFKHKQARWAELDEALCYFNIQLKERLLGDDPVDLRGTKQLDPSFNLFKDRAPVLLKDVSDTNFFAGRHC